MNFTRYFITSILLTIIFVNPLCSHAKKNDQPNVVVIFIDDMGYADLSCFGNPLVKTPNIDALARNGKRFTNFYVNAPICSPSRVALATGNYPMRYKIHSHLDNKKRNAQRGMANYLEPDVMTMAKAFKNAGYTTAHFGKWHIGGGRDVQAPLPKEYGFDESLVSFEGLGDRLLFNKHGLSKQSAKLANGKITWVGKHQTTGIYVDKALDFIERNKEKPFFINLFPNDVHDPHLPEENKIEKYKSITDHPFEQKFLAVLENLDHEIGRFVNKLNEKGLMENTIIVFTSDNGPTDWGYYYKREKYPEAYTGKLYSPGFAGDFRGRKWSLYEGGIREPFFIVWKDRIKANTVDSSTVVSGIDLLPSLCKLANIKPPKAIDGQDKSKAFFGKKLKMKKPIMWEFNSPPGGSIVPGGKENRSPHLALRFNEWKLLTNVDSTHIELYNLIDDPSERDNKLQHYPEKARELIRHLLDWRRSMPVSTKE